MTVKEYQKQIREQVKNFYVTYNNKELDVIQNKILEKYSDKFILN